MSATCLDGASTVGVLPEDPLLVFVGAIVPDKPAFITSAFSRAGQIYQRELLEGLLRAGVRVSEIISIIPIPSFPKSNRFWVNASNEEIIPGVRTVLLPFFNVILLKQVTIGIFALLHLARWGWRNRNKPNRVVYTYNLTTPHGLFTLLGARLIRAKAVVSLCDIDVPGQTVPDHLGWRLNFWAQKLLIPRFNGHVVAADAIAQDFLPSRSYLRLDGGMTSVLLESMNGVRKSAKSADAPFVIGFAGRLDQTNGIPSILECFSLLEGNGYQLLIAGSGPLEMQVKEASAKDQRILYKGLLPTHGVLELYSESDLLVNMRMTNSLNTKYFFPSKLLEYMASGRPVISTCTGHTEAEFGNFLYLLRDETAHGLAEMIRTLARLKSDERERVGQEAREYMAAHKTWDAQARRVAEFICKDVLGKEFIRQHSDSADVSVT